MNIEEVYKLAGDKEDLIKKLINFLQNSYQPDIKYSFSKKSGWTIFFRKSGRSLCYVNIKENEFFVTIVIGIGLNDEIEKSEISKNTKEMFIRAKQFHDGKWLNFNITNPSQIEDIKNLLYIKKRPIKKL